MRSACSFDPKSGLSFAVLMLVIERGDRMRHCWLISLIFVLVLVSDLGFSQDLSDYLILNDIGDYKFITHMKDFITGEIKPKPGYRTRISPGVLAGADHFDLDHDDTTYETDYINKTVRLAVDVQVTQHAGGDSDKWLLHEVERSFRRGDYEENMTPARFRNIDGSNIFYSGLGGGTYRWISNNVVINIEYADLYRQEPEPLEVVRAYLAKFPSTITTITKDNAHNEKWIRDEMERRLWLCDKWFQQLHEGKTDQYKALSAVVDDHLKVFLDYRKKYYGINAGEEKQVLYGYLQVLNEKEIRNKLTEYKKWWSSNKTRAPAL